MNKNIDLNKLKKKIQKYEYISFDIFDTLIKRNINNPNQLPMILEKKYNITHFANERIDSEINCWKYENQKCFDFASIYENIKNISDKQKNELMQEEVQLEKKICTVNYNMIDIYNYCKRIGKKIILISDMYLPKKIIEEILDKNGIFEYEKIYISSEYGMTKSNGTLFDFVIKDLDVEPQKILHIGDSLRGDYLMPKKQKMVAIKIPNKIDNLSYQKYGKETYSLDDNILQNFINNNILKIDDEYEKIGYETLGTLLIGFLNWVKKQCELKNIKNVYFLSRDGYIMKKAFNILFPDNEIKSYYFLASRRSLTVPLLSNISDFSEVLEIVNFRKIETFSSILKRVGIEQISNDDDEIKDLEINRDKLKSDRKLIDKFNKYLNQIKSNAEFEKKSFIEYFNKFVKSDHIAIVDIGWHGTMQKCVTKILEDSNINCKINGYYIGLTEKGEENKECFIFNNKIDDFNPNLVSAFRGVIESFFSANHGSAKRYTDDCEVELEPFEQSNYNKRVIKKIHKGALKCVEEYNKLGLDIYEGITGKYAFKPLYNLMTKPDFNTINILKNIDFFDTQNRKLIENRKITDYLLEPKILIEDLANSDWRIGYLKNTFKIFNNYDKIVEVIYKILRR